MQRAWAFTRPVTNAYLSRERDRRRRRELAWVLLVALPVGVCCMAYVWLHLETLRTGYRVHELEQTLVERLERERHLLLEGAALAAPERIERLATGKLGMVAPGVEQLLFAEELARERE